MAQVSESQKNIRTMSNSVGSSSSTVLVVALVIAALYFGRQIFVPLALAVLLSFMLAPALSWLQRHGVPRIPAAVGVVTLAFAIICIFAFVVVGSLTQLAENLPSYQSNIQTKIQTIKIGGAPDSLFGRISAVIQELSNEVDRPAESAAPAEPPPSAVGGESRIPPIPVEIAKSDLSSLQMVQTVIGPMIAPLVTLGIVIVFVIFILIYRHDLRDRLIRLTSMGDLNRTTQALEEAGLRIAKYLLMQLVVNLSYGIPIGVGLWLIGVPNPLLWGMLAVVLRFVPYVGPLVAAIFPIALSIAVAPGWTMLLLTISLFVIVEIISNNFVEPWLYGAKTGLSPIAILVSAIFWTWLWGPVGLLLSTPLTVCLFVLGRHVPQFTFLSVLLGSDPVLTHEESLRQRLLALDADEATEIAEDYLQQHSLEEFYGDVAIPALVSIEWDRARGVIDEARRGKVVDSIMTLIDNLSDFEDEPTIDSETGKLVATDRAKTFSSAPHPGWRGYQVLLVGARGNLDDAAAAILTQLAKRRGIPARTMSLAAAGTRSADLVGEDAKNTQMVCLLYLNENPIAHARRLTKRLRRHMPTTTTLASFLSLSDDRSAQSEQRKALIADIISTSLVDTLNRISDACRGFENAAIHSLGHSENTVQVDSLGLMKLRHDHGR